MITEEFEYEETNSIMLVLLLEQLRLEMETKVHKFQCSKNNQNDIDRENDDMWSQLRGKYRSSSNSRSLEKGTRIIQFSVDQEADDKKLDIILQWKVVYNKMIVRTTDSKMIFSEDDILIFDLNKMSKKDNILIKKNFNKLFGKINYYQNVTKKIEEKEKIVNSLRGIFPNIFDSLLLGTVGESDEE